MSKIKLQIDTENFMHKPTGDEVRLIRGRLKTHELELTEIAEKLSQGKTVLPAVLNGTKSDDFTQQQVFLVDIDNDGIKNPSEALQPEDALKLYTDNGITPAFWYPTFSSTDEHPKYRIGFVCEEIITDKTQRDAIQEGLQSLLPQSDKSCKDAARIFYGTDKKVVIL